MTARRIALAMPLYLGLGLGQTAPSAPKITLSVNGSGIADGVRGWPLLLKAVVQHSRQFGDGVDPIDIAHGDAGWASAVSLSVVDANGKPVQWTMRTQAPPDAVLHLDGNGMDQITWQVGPADSARIPYGTYTIRALLDNTDVQVQKWQGSLVSQPASVTVRDPPAPLAPADDVRQAQLFANYYALSGDVPSALAALDDLAIRQPDHVGSLTLRGMLLESAGNSTDALTAYERAAIAFYAQYPNSTEAPKFLLLLRNTLRAKLQVP